MQVVFSGIRGGMQVVFSGIRGGIHVHEVFLLKKLVLLLTTA